MFYTYFASTSLQFIVSLTVATLNAVMGLSMSDKYYWQILDADLPKAICSYCSSPLLNVAMAAKMSLCHLIPLLDPKITKHLAMSELMASKVEESNYCDNTTKESLSLLNMLSYIASLMDKDVTVSSIISNPKVLTSVLKIIGNSLQLSKDCTPEMEAAIFVIWRLTLKGVSFSDEDELVAQVLSLTGASVASLQTMAFCVSWKLIDGPLEGKYALHSCN